MPNYLLLSCCASGLLFIMTLQRIADYFCIKIRRLSRIESGAARGTLRSYVTYRCNHTDVSALDHVQRSKDVRFHHQRGSCTLQKGQLPGQKKLALPEAVPR